MPAPNSAPDLGRLVSATYAQLHDLARHFRGTPLGFRSQTTSLIHEAYLRLRRNDSLAFRDEGHFLRIAAQAMRLYLVDRARAAFRQKRGTGRTPVALVEEPTTRVVSAIADGAQLLDLDEALGRLNEISARKAQVVELRYFGGCTFEKIAEVLGVSLSTVCRDWDFSRAWIRHELSRGEEESSRDEP